MPKNNPDFLMNMLYNVEDGKTVRGKRGNLEITRSDNSRFLEVYHFGTLILHIDFHANSMIEKVKAQYGESTTDARYVKCILDYYNLLQYFDVGYGSVNGWRFSAMYDTKGNPLDKKDWIEDYNYKGRYE